MTHQEKLGAIRESCVGANPIRFSNHDDDGEVRLADVLLAMRGLNYISIDPSGDFWQTSTSGRSHLVANWNLRADSLEDQSPETISFIHSLLKP